MLNEEGKDHPDWAQATGTPHTRHEESEPGEVRKTNWRAPFRTAFARVRRPRRSAAGRRELSRDKSKAFFFLLGTGVVFLLLFFGIFSAPQKHTRLPGETPHGQASLGRKMTQGQENAGKAMTPMLSADIHSTDSGPAQVTPEDVGRTSLSSPAEAGSTRPSPAKNYSPDSALSQVDFSDPLAGQSHTVPPLPPATRSEPPSSKDQSADLKKPSLVFVRSIEARPTIQPSTQNKEEEESLSLPAGTRLVARLQTPVSSALAAPVVAAVEYNYERDGQIVLPAGAKVFGHLAQANASGDVGISFDRVEMPDGTSEKIEASAMDLNFGPLKGYVSGKKTGTKFLVRSLTGLGTAASYLLGPQATSSAGLISTNTLIRERLADNLATAGQEELNGVAFNQNLVVTVPGNTRFYIVVQKQTSDDVASNSAMRNTRGNTGPDVGVPTLEELRQLLQLKREINELYLQGSSQSSSQSQ